MTKFGDCDVCVQPAGIATGFLELERNAVTYDLDGLLVHVASLADVIRSKEVTRARS